jgi:hypothetical protein
VYSQTNLAGSTGNVPGLYDQFGLLAGPESTRKDFYEIFSNNTGHGVLVNTAVVFGSVNNVSEAVLAPVIIGTASGVGDILVPDRDPEHVLARASVPVGPTPAGTIALSFSPGVYMPPGGRLAFGFVVPLTSDVDANLYGTDTLPCGFSSTAPTYFTCFYATTVSGDLFLAIGNHYLVIAASSGIELSVRSAQVEHPKRGTNGPVQLWADFSAELPLPNDIVSMNLDGAQLFSEPFSAFFRLGHGQTYILLKKGVLAWFDFKEGELSVVTPKADLALFDPSNGVDVALRIGGASGTENIKMVQQGSRRFVYRRP